MTIARMGRCAMCVPRHTSHGTSGFACHLVIDPDYLENGIFMPPGVPGDMTIFPISAFGVCSGGLLVYPL